MIPQKSKKHLLSIPISILFSFLLTHFSLLDWHNIPFFVRLFITAFVWFCIGFTFEAYQQWDKKEKPTQADTVADIITTLTGGVLGFIIVELFYTLMRWV